MTTMTYGQLVEAYVAVREERDRLRADDLAIRRLLRDHGASVGGTDPLPAIVAETLDAARKTGAELVELRDRHEQVCEELAEAREALVAAQTEGDEAWDRLSTLVDELAGALEMPGTPDDHEIIREARAFGQLRVELAALRAEREWLADRARQMGIADAIITTYGPAHAISAEIDRLRAKRHQARAALGTTPDTGSTTP